MEYQKERESKPTINQFENLWSTANLNSWHRIQHCVLKVSETCQLGWSRLVGNLYHFERTCKSLISAFWSTLSEMIRSIFWYNSPKQINNWLMFFFFIVYFLFHWKFYRLKYNFMIKLRMLNNARNSKVSLKPFGWKNCIREFRAFKFFFFSVFSNGSLISVTQKNLNAKMLEIQIKFLENISR